MTCIDDEYLVYLCMYLLQFLDHEAFYLCLDNSLLVDLIRTDIAYLKTNWKLVGRPTIVLPILRCVPTPLYCPSSGVYPHHCTAHPQVCTHTLVLPILRCVPTPLYCPSPGVYPHPCAAHPQVHMITLFLDVIFMMYMYCYYHNRVLFSAGQCLGIGQTLTSPQSTDCCTRSPAATLLEQGTMC